MVYFISSVFFIYFDAVCMKSRKIYEYLKDHLLFDTMHAVSMTTNYICIHENLNIRQAMSELVRQAGENDNISTIYVVDDKEIFCGAIDLKDLLVAREYENLDDLIVRSYPYVLDHENIGDCIEQIKEYAEDSIPVLSSDGKIVGIITSSDIVEVVDDEMGDDYAKLAGLTAEEDLHETTVQSMKKRLPWLILDMAGNVGTQSLAVTIRVLMDENLTGKQKISLVIKEMKIGLLNGSFLGIMAFLFLGLYIRGFKHYDWLHAFMISGCVGISLVIAMVISSFVGTMIPMFFHKIKVDPAVASGPLITTVNDLVAVLTYYGLALVFLINIFHIAG